MYFQSFSSSKDKENGKSLLQGGTLNSLAYTAMERANKTYLNAVHAQPLIQRQAGTKQGPARTVSAFPLLVTVFVPDPDGQN